MPRSTHALAILGPQLYASLSTTRILIVGAGGIGCELVKNIVLAGFGDITLLDLDTIDLSNLNRQFLFRKKDVKQSKALVAAKTVSAFNPACKITPIHGNIKESHYDVSWFQGFAIVLNALDNLDARRHVNRMCMAAGVPLIESGTAGYLGQVQPLLKDTTECFDCLPKPTPKSFPVCTIRSTPSAPIHCIVWAKSYLFPQLFGEDEDDTSDLDAAAAAGEDATEIDNLRKEASAFKTVRAAMLSSDTTESASTTVFKKVFTSDIERLLTMGDMWASRKPPVPLQRDAILEGSFVLAAPAASTTSNGSAKGSSTSGAAGSSANAAKIKDQRELTLRDNVELFDSSLARLATRLQSGPKGSTLSFDKDDDDTLDFVTATANLRAWAYGIPSLTRWQVKEMAGNIIPAIATTNAVISGLIVLQALHVLRAAQPSAPSTKPESQPLSAIRNVFLQSGRPSVPLGAYKASPPVPACGVCRETYVAISCDPKRVTLGELVDAVLRAEFAGEKREVSVYEEGKLWSDPDWDENLERTLDDLNCGRGKFITLVDEDERLGNLVLCITSLPSDHPTDSPAYILPHIPTPPHRPLPPAPPSRAASPLELLPPTPEKNSQPKSKPTLSKKRPAPSDEDEIVPANKRVKSGHISRQEKVLEEDGVVIIEDDDDVELPLAVTGNGNGKARKEEIALEDDGFIIIED